MTILLKHGAKKERGFGRSTNKNSKKVKGSIIEKNMGYTGYTLGRAGEEGAV